MTLGRWPGSGISVADLTHKWLNCYLEVGYALGAGRIDSGAADSSDSVEYPGRSG